LQTLLHFRKSPNDDPPPEMLKTTPTGYLNCLPENRLVVFPSPLCGAGKLSGSIISIKCGLFPIQFDLV
ncbi:hypothetical protein ACQP3L_34940, partial [Escherichia coli]